MKLAPRLHLLKLPTILLCSAVMVAQSAFGSGTVTNCTQPDLETALMGGGTVLFACNGTITLTNTITIAADTTLDANGSAVRISGGSAVRLFEVISNVSFRVNGLILADGHVVGMDGLNGDPAQPGQDAVGACILNQAGKITLVDCVITNHSVQGGNAGYDVTTANGNMAPGGNGLGAAVCNFGGTLDLTNCVMAFNVASGGAGSPNSAPGATNGGFGGNGGLALGGAIYSAGGNVTLLSVIVTNNSNTGGTALGGFGAGPSVEISGGIAAGGALYLTNSSLLLDASVLRNNATTGGPAFRTFSVGGDGLGGAMFLSADSSAIARHSTFANDVATGGVGANAIPDETTSGAGRGGSVFNGGELQLQDSEVSGCDAAPGPAEGVGTASGQGGGIYSTNKLIINGCAFVTNTATGGASSPPSGTYFPTAPGEGGAVWNSGSLALTNSTIAGCSAFGPSTPFFPGAAEGGGLYVSGGTATLVNVTVAGNSAAVFWSRAGPGTILGGGLFSANATTTLLNSILANSGNGGDVWGQVVDAGHNICSDGTANLSAPTSLNQADPMLSALSDNGGPTPTMALLAGSPARDAIPSGFPPTDQRGTSRPQGPAADIGAFEADSLLTAAPPQLTVSRLMNGLSITLSADGARTYVLLSSTNLALWSPVATNAAALAGPLQFVQPFATQSALFYRVVVQ